MNRRADQVVGDTMTPQEGINPVGGGTRRIRPPKLRLDGSDLVEAAQACFKQLYEYTSALSTLPQDSADWGKWLEARGSVEFEF